MTSPRAATLLATLAFLALGAPVRAQCTKDTDCKGDRVCVDGACATPLTTGAALESAPRPFAPRPVRSGWASGAGGLGIGAGALVLGLSIGSELTKEETIPSLPLGIAATVLLAAMGPVVASGGSSARADDRVSGLLGLRIGGWVAYGLSMANAIALVALGVADITPTDGQITLTGALGMASLLCFSLDAFASGSQARRLAKESSAAAVEPDEGLRWGLSISPLWREAKVAGGAVGVGGTF